MPYKDKDKQKEAQRNWVRQKRAEGKGSTPPKQIDLPACVPGPVRGRYARGEPEYVKTIDTLLNHTITELEATDVWIPVWRHIAGEEAPQLACVGLKE